ncbi:MAG: hypothetical protein Q7U37_12870 [Gallionella sp.]|nr:hypothetical protein [Gallionella sp.]
MALPRMTVITLGIANLARATGFYSTLFRPRPSRNTKCPLHTAARRLLSLRPLEKLAEDIAQNTPLPAA